jgi:hypothetical protein
MEQEKNQIPLTLFAKGGIFSITPLMKEVQSEGTPIFILTAQ